MPNSISRRVDMRHVSAMPRCGMRFLICVKPIDRLRDVCDLMSSKPETCRRR